ncbi:ABC transporter ATP-binding protein [Eubacteriales bacterium KG127]
MIVEVENLTFAYSGQKNIFSNASFSLDEGEVLTILGPNGSGKSTLLNCISNIITPRAGRVLLNNRNIRDMKEKDIAKILGYVPQMHSPTFSYSVREFVLMGRAAYLGVFQKPTRLDYTMSDEAISKLNISHLEGKSYTEISGGERQQVLIARAIAQNPKVLIFDEPTNHLDYGNQLRVMKIIKDLAKEGYAIVMTTHIPDHAIILGGKVAILDKKGILTVGESEKIINEKLLKSIYKADIKVKYIDEIGRKVCFPGNTN